MRKRIRPILLIGALLILFLGYQYAPLLFPENDLLPSELADFPLPADDSLLADLATFPIPSDARELRWEPPTLAFETEASAESLLEFYRRELIKRGWEDNWFMKTEQPSFVFTVMDDRRGGSVRIAELNIVEEPQGSSHVSIKISEIDFSADP
jgi:hypothetical protein